jgi:hypothetical protein
MVASRRAAPGAASALSRQFGSENRFHTCLTPVPTRESGLSAADFLFLCEALEALFTESWQTVQETATPGTWVIIDGSRHGSYSDAPFLPAGAEILRSIVGGATIEPERMWRLTGDLLLAFFNTHLLGNAAPVLADPSSVYPEAQRVDREQ